MPDAPPNFPSIDVTFDEAKARLEAEEKRFESLESKANYVLTAAGLVLTFLGFQTLKLAQATSGAVAVLMLGAFACALISVRLRGYTLPHGPPDGYFAFAKLGHAEARRKFLLNYVVAIEENTITNSGKASWLLGAFWLLFAGLAAMGIDVAWFG